MRQHDATQHNTTQREFEARARESSSATSFLRLNPNNRGGGGGGGAVGGAGAVGNDAGEIAGRPHRASDQHPQQYPHHTPFQFPSWGGGRKDGGGDATVSGGRGGWRGQQQQQQQHNAFGSGGRLGARTGLAALFASSSASHDDDDDNDDERGDGEWPPRGGDGGMERGLDDEERGGRMPAGLMRGVGGNPGRGLLFDTRRGGGGGGGGGGRGGVVFRQDRGGAGEEDMGPAEFRRLMGEEGGQEPLLADDWVRSGRVFSWCRAFLGYFLV